MNRKIKKSLKAILICFLIAHGLNILEVTFAKLCFSRYSYGYITQKNRLALKTAYDLTPILSTLELPKDEIVLLSGECKYDENYKIIIYSNEYIESKVFEDEQTIGEHEG